MIVNDTRQVSRYSRFARFRGFRGFGDGEDPSGGTDAEGDSLITHDPYVESSSAEPAAAPFDWQGLFTGVTGAIKGVVSVLAPGATPVRTGIAGQAAAGTARSVPKKLPGSVSTGTLVAIGGAAVLGLALLKKRR